MDDIKHLTAQLTKPGPVDAVDLDAAGSALGIRWPDDYRSYMLDAGGGVGSVGEGYLALWAASDIVETNGPTVQAFEPQLVGIGTDGGGELFAYDTSQGTPRLVMTPMVDLLPTSWIEIGSFRDLLVRLAEDRLFEPRDLQRR